MRKRAKGRVRTSNDLLEAGWMAMNKHEKYLQQELEIICAG
jgi:hypothetical protein